MRRLAKQIGMAALVIGMAAGGWASGARADFAYGYAQQTLTNITVTGAGLLGANPTGSSTTASAAINGSGTATNDPTDAREAYQGALPPAPQNDFTKYSTTGGGPQPGDFTRGDVVVTGLASLFTTGTSASNVAESFISTNSGGSVGPGLLTGSGSWTINGVFSSTGTAVTVGYSYFNDIITQVSGNGTASASFKVAISIKDQHGHEVDANPSELSTALSSPPNGPEIITRGTSSATLSLTGLTANDTYSISITGTELSAVTFPAAVPEPASLAMLGLGLAGVGTVVRMRRRA